MKLFSILKKDFLILIRNQADMAVLFIMPLAFIIPISLALGNGDGYGIGRDNHMIQLPVINYDGGPRAQDLLAIIGESVVLENNFTAEMVTNLGLADDPDCAQVVAPYTPTPESTKTQVTETADPDPNKTIITSPAPTAELTPTASPPPTSGPACSEKVARVMLQRSWRGAMLLIPSEFSAAVDAGKPAEVTLLYDPGGDSIQFQQIEGVIKGATVRISVENRVNAGLDQLNNLVIFAPQEIRSTINRQVLRGPAKGQQPAVNLRKVAPENYQFSSPPDTYQQTLPGYSVMFVFFIATSMVGSIRQERLNGTFRRLLSAPTSRAELLGGKLLASLLIGLIQVFILFLVGALVFRIGLGNDPLAFLLLTAALVFTAASLGLAISTTQIKGAGFSALLIIAALLGGSMFPLDLMPPFLRSLSNLVPHSWAINGYQNLMVRGLGLQEVLPQIGMLLGF
ncbi:MAG: ABC transporter permease, partial [Anaerolineaceae bacterium]|nr:ABC transporter permease [Anaerolineaceae bacterium]